MMYRSIPRIAVAVTALALATACSSNDKATNPTVQKARVRVVNLLPTAANAGLFANGAQVGSNVAFGSAGATCFDVPVGQTLSFRSSGSANNLTQNASAGLVPGQNYTVVLFGTSASPQMAVLSDANITAPSAGNNAIRVFNATATAGDVWITAPNAATTGTPSVGNVTPGSTSTTFRSFPTANTQIRLFNTGTTTGTPRVNTTFSSTNLSASRVGNAFLTESTLPGGTTNASVVAAPCS